MIQLEIYLNIIQEHDAENANKRPRIITIRKMEYLDKENAVCRIDAWRSYAFDSELIEFKGFYRSRICIFNIYILGTFL